MIDVDHADIVVTHNCNYSCKHCIDKFKGQSKQSISLKIVNGFLYMLNEYTSKKFSVLLLGGEPTMAGSKHLKAISELIHLYGFRTIISTNGSNKKVINDCLEFMDWVQITAKTEKELTSWANNRYTNKINIKYIGDHRLDLQKLQEFIDISKNFGRASISMYFTPDFKELCTDKDVWELLNTLSWKRNGSYLYAFYNGVRIKRCIPEESNIIDEPTIPKLYPNGNYNKSWQHENLDPYLGPIIY